VHPYRVDVSSILEDLGAVIHEEAAISLGGFAVGDEEFLLVEPLSFSVDLANTGSGIVASGSVRASVTATCSRCLEPFPLVIDGDVEGFYVHPGKELEIPEEQEVEPIGNDDTVDLAPALLAALTLEAPFAPLHDESCAGLCPVCGTNLNDEQCGCHAEDLLSSPLAGLKDLLDEDEIAR
jgi:uncharacterized protein